MSSSLRAFFQFPITFSRVAWSILDCARHSHPPNPERAEARSSPTRARGRLGSLPPCPCWRIFSASCDVRCGGVLVAFGGRGRDRMERN